VEERQRLQEEIDFEQDSDPMRLVGVQELSKNGREPPGQGLHRVPIRRQESPILRLIKTPQPLLPRVPQTHARKRVLPHKDRQVARHPPKTQQRANRLTFERKH